MFQRSTATVAARMGLGVALALLIGCGSDGKTGLLEKEIAQQTVGVDLLKQRGAKFTEKQYKQGKAWAIDLSGLTITDDMMAALKQVGPITDLNFNKSTLNDAQMAKINERSICGFLLVLDVGHTEVGDAGLEQLKDDGLLTKLVLTGSKVTPQGLARWKKAREDDTRILAMFKHPKVVQ